MLKKLERSIITIIVIILILSSNIMIALATTQSDLDDIQNKIDKTEKEI